MRAGRCLRLYSRHDFDTRPDHQAPEIRRLDLAETALALHGAGVKDLASFEWFEAPAPAALSAAETLLARLGAVDSSGALTDTGREMLRFPLHPRQARVLLEADRRGRGKDGCLLAALIGEREIRLEARTSFGGGPAKARVSGPSDLLESLAAFREAERKNLAPAALRSLGLDVGAAHAVDRVRKSLERRLRGKPAARNEGDDPLLIATLAGYPDRVARRRKGEPGAPSAELLLCGGAGAARLSEASVVRDAAFLVAVDAEERGRAGSKDAVVRVASAVEPEWLLDLFPDRVREGDEVVWNAGAERVDAVSRLLYEDLVIEESRNPRAASPAATKLLAEQALARGPRAFVEPEELDGFLARVELVRKLAPEADFAQLGEEQAREALAELCEGRRSFAELREASLLDLLRSRLAPAQLASLERLAPERVRLPGGRQTRIHYEAGKPPWIESRLQDFFGMADGPAVGSGRMPVVLHLLAPNGRAVQVTTDLSGFWDRHYPAIRKELCRKYPRHSWPEDPRTAEPPKGNRIR